MSTRTFSARSCCSTVDIARDTPNARILGVQYEMHQWSAAASLVRQWGTDYKQTVTFGHSVASVDPRLLPSFPGNAVERDAFIRDVLPRNEFTSTPFVSYSLFTPKFKTVRNVSTYELAEEFVYGPSLTAAYSVGLEALGS